MEVNVGKVDRIVRAVIGVIALILAVIPFVGYTFLFNEWVQLIIFGIIAVIMFFTAATSYCPLYKIFGINTCKTA